MTGVGRSVQTSIPNSFHFFDEGAPHGRGLFLELSSGWRVTHAFQRALPFPAGVPVLVAIPAVVAPAAAIQATLEDHGIWQESIRTRTLSQYIITKNKRCNPQPPD